MVINKKALLYSLLAGSACIASHACAMNQSQEDWTDTADMAPRSSSSSSQPPGHRSYGSIVPGDPLGQANRLTLNTVLGTSFTPAHHAPASAHTSGGTKEEEEAGPSGLGRKRKRSDRR